MDFLPNGKVRLTPSYSHREDVSFTFLSGENNSGSLVVDGNDKEYISNIQPAIKYWIGECQSIPGFLAIITLDTFTRRSGMSMLDSSLSRIQKI